MLLVLMSRRMITIFPKPLTPLPAYSPSSSRPLQWSCTYNSNRSYFFGGFLFSSSILIFILVIILTALDFWTVKNVTGRLLVGLRWWSDYDEKGKEIWKFESYDKEFNANPVDTTFFWTSQIAFTVFWAVMFILKVLTLSFYWVLLVGICLSLSFTNLYGYYKCRGGTDCYYDLEYSKKVGDIQNKLKQAGMKQIFNKLF
jgi:hypothetical protein